MRSPRFWRKISSAVSSGEVPSEVACDLCVCVCVCRLVRD